MIIISYFSKLRGYTNTRTYSLITLLLFCSCLNGYCYEDKSMGYRINFPKGWKLEKTSTSNMTGMTATSYNGSQLGVGVLYKDVDKFKSFEATDSYAYYIAKNLTYNIYSRACRRLSIVNAHTAKIDGKDGVANTLACDNEHVSTMYIMNNGKIYSLIGVYSSPNSYDTKLLENSIQTFKFVK